MRQALPASRSSRSSPSSTPTRGRACRPARRPERLQRLGANELSERPRPGLLSLLWQQFDNYLVIILVIAAVISAALGEYVDSIAILVIVVLNAVVGVVQESKAEQALAASRRCRRPMRRCCATVATSRCPAASWWSGTWSGSRRATTCRPTSGWSSATT